VIRFTCKYRRTRKLYSSDKGWHIHFLKSSGLTRVFHSTIRKEIKSSVLLEYNFRHLAFSVATKVGITRSRSNWFIQFRSPSLPSFL